MLLELRVENLLLIERAELRLGAGLNAITGETGAGKTMLAHALDLLLGGKPRPGIVRPGRRRGVRRGGLRAAATGCWTIRRSTSCASACPRATRRSCSRGGWPPKGPARIRSGALRQRRGPARARRQARSPSTGSTSTAGWRVVLHPARDARRLLRRRAPGARGSEFAAAHARGAGARARARGAARARGRAASASCDLLALELEEIEALRPSVGEKERAVAVRERLRALEGLRAAAGGGAEALAPGRRRSRGGRAAGRRRARWPRRSRGPIRQLDALAGAHAHAALEAEDLGVRAAPLRGRARGRAGPARGGGGAARPATTGSSASTAARRGVLAHAERCRASWRCSRTPARRSGRIEAELAAARADADARASELSAARAKAAPRLAKAVLAELDELAMAGARVRGPARAAREPLPLGRRARGVPDLARTPGVAPQPLRETASGGEISRVMLALMSVANAGGQRHARLRRGRRRHRRPDRAGGGGEAARARGQRARCSASPICRRSPRSPSATSRSTRTGRQGRPGTRRAARGRRRDRGAVRMLGADTSDSGARRHAQELLAAA